MLSFDCAPPSLSIGPDMARANRHLQRLPFPGIMPSGQLNAESARARWAHSCETMSSPNWTRHWANCTSLAGYVDIQQLRLGTRLYLCHLNHLTDRSGTHGQL